MPQEYLEGIDVHADLSPRTVEIEDNLRLHQACRVRHASRTGAIAFARSGTHQMADSAEGIPEEQEHMFARAAAAPEADYRARAGEH